MGITSKRYHFEDNQFDKMIEMYSEGYSLEDIAVHMGCTRETIRYHLRKRKVNLRGRGMQTEIARAKYSGAKHHGWKGGRYLDHGYWSILMRSHPHADQDGYVREHRYLIEQYLLHNDPTHPALVDGVLSKKWTVHHVNGVKSDNTFSNLELMESHKHHSWMHYKQDIQNLKFEVVRLKMILDRNNISY
jgi:hypothetical protein